MIVGTSCNRADDFSGRVVFHADDLGMNRAVNGGIIRGFQHGLLTSASVLTNAPEVSGALARWKRLLADHQAGRLPSTPVRQRLGDPCARFDLGVHLNLTQGRPLTSDRYPRELLDQRGYFPGVFKVFRRLRRWGAKFRKPLEAELAEQVQVLLDHGLRPTHLNGHHYLEMIPAVAEIIPELLRCFNIKVVRVAVEPCLFRSTVLNGLQVRQWVVGCVKRHYARRFWSRMRGLAVSHCDAFFGSAHAGRIDLDLMRMFLARRKRSRLVEIGLHPAEVRCGESANDCGEGWHDPLGALRPKELEMLMSPQLPELLRTHRLRLARLSGLAAV